MPKHSYHNKPLQIRLQCVLEIGLVIGYKLINLNMTIDMGPANKLYASIVLVSLSDFWSTIIVVSKIIYTYIEVFATPNPVNNIVLIC